MSVFEETLRYGGAQADNEDGEEANRKREEREKKKAEVRKRLEEAGQKKKGKKGFLTPERKKKLRKLLMLKAAEDLKRQQLLKEQERVKILSQRTIALPNVDSIDDKGKLESIYNELFARVCTLEEEKYEVNQIVTQHETNINQLNIEVNDLRGKFVKPSLKKVSKYDNKFKKMAAAKGESKQDMRSNLKVVKKESVITQIANTKKSEKPQWSTKKKEEKKEEAAPASAAEPVADEPVEEVEEDAGDEEEEEEE